MPKTIDSDESARKLNFDSTDLLHGDGKIKTLNPYKFVKKESGLPEI